jgi:hypothetical protein
MMMILGNECEREMVWGKSMRGERKRKVLRGEED